MVVSTEYDREDFKAFIQRHPDYRDRYVDDVEFQNRGPHQTITIKSLSSRPKPESKEKVAERESTIEVE